MDQPVRAVYAQKGRRLPPHPFGGRYVQGGLLDPGKYGDPDVGLGLYGLAKPLGFRKPGYFIAMMFPLQNRASNSLNLQKKTQPLFSNQEIQPCCRDNGGKITACIKSGIFIFYRFRMHKNNSIPLIIRFHNCIQTYNYPHWSA